jgi:transcriptional regulator with XRE-family HTH domain
MPTISGRRLANELKHLRLAAALTIGQAAAHLECSDSKISRIETGRAPVMPRDARDLADLYGATAEQRDRLIQLARDSRKKGWWQVYGNTINPQVATFLDFESAAQAISIYRTNRIPGLLRTSQYARATFAADWPAILPRRDNQDGSYWAELRQQAWTTLPSLQVVLDEAALRRPVGGPQVMREQLERLISLSTSPRLRMQVIPFAVESQANADLPFGILTFPDPADTDIVCVRYPTGALWIEDKAEVDQYHQLFRRVQATALPPQDTVDLITSVLKEL